MNTYLIFGGHVSGKGGSIQLFYCFSIQVMVETFFHF